MPSSLIRTVCGSALAALADLGKALAGDELPKASYGISIDNDRQFVLRAGER